MSRRLVQRARAGLGAGVIFLAAAVYAADDSKIIYPSGSGRAETAAPASAGGSLHKMSLLLAVALAGVGGWLFWRNRQRTLGPRDSHALQLQETRSLGNRQYLVVASYEGKKFLLGVCPGRIDLLTPLEGGPAPARKAE